MQIAGVLFRSFAIFLLVSIRESWLPSQEGRAISALKQPIIRRKIVRERWPHTKCESAPRPGHNVQARVVLVFSVPLVVHLRGIHSAPALLETNANATKTSRARHRHTHGVTKAVSWLLPRSSTVMVLGARKRERAEVRMTHRRLENVNSYSLSFALTPLFRHFFFGVDLFFCVAATFLLSQSAAFLEAEE